MSTQKKHVDDYCSTRLLFVFGTLGQFLIRSGMQGQFLIRSKMHYYVLSFPECFRVQNKTKQKQFERET